MKRSDETAYLPNVKRRTALIIGALTLVLTGCNSAQTGVNPAANAASGSSGASAPAEAALPVTPPVTVIPQGTMVEVRIDQELSTEMNRPGDKFVASLELPLDIGGREVLPRRTRVRGHVTTSRSSGRLEGRAALGITLDTVEFNGASIPITTTLDTKTSAAHKKHNIEFIGGGSALGAVIGAIAGGGKGAAIGAAAGAGAGTAGAAATGREQVHIPAETVFTFRLKAPVELR